MFSSVSLRHSNIVDSYPNMPHKNCGVSSSAQKCENLADFAPLLRGVLQFGQYDQVREECALQIDKLGQQSKSYTIFQIKDRIFDLSSIISP